MIYEKIALGVGKAYLTAYVGDNLKGDAMLVLPGGGYACVCSDREGEPIALSYLSKGLNCFVLEYSVGKDAKGHMPLVEASAAIAYIRRNARKYGVTGKIYCVGFSAGGHLAGSLATLWHREEVIKAAGIEYGENRPDGAVLCYPVVSGFEMAHKGSFYNIIGSTSPTKEELAYYSLEMHVDEKSAPAFIMHTANDELVSVENSLYLAEAYSKAKVPFELHIYPDAPHGLALCNEVTYIGKKDYIRPQAARWVDDSIYFLKHLK